MRRTWIVSSLVIAGAIVAGTLARPRVVSGEDAAKATYIGAEACKKCHLKQFKSWKDTGMAKTFESLKPGQAAEKKTKCGLDPNADYTKDEKCLKCHTTGYGKDGGYPKVEAGKEMTPEQQAAAKLTEGVACEACHGAGSLYGPFKKDHPEYKVAEIVALGALSPPKAEHCEACHVKECPTMPADYAFKFEEAVKKADAMHEHVPLKKQH